MAPHSSPSRFAHVLTLSLAFTLAAALPARADEAEAAADSATANAEAETVEDVAGSIVRNVRRAIAIGPTLGVFGAYEPSGSIADVGISAGLAAELFRSSVPSPARVRELAQAKAKAKLIQLIRDRYNGQRPDEETMRRLAREIVSEVRAEVLAELRAGRPRLLERPRLTIAIEANYLADAGDWLPRFGAGFGLGPLSIGPTLSVRLGDDTVAQLGAELSLHLLPTKSHRSPVFDIFARGDFELHTRDTAGDLVEVGVRMLFDLF